MRNPLREGNLASTPLPQLLFWHWQKKNSGRLWLNNGEAEQTLFLYNGNPAMVESSLTATEFQTALIERAFLTPEQAEQILLSAEARSISFARALIEHRFLNPAQAWELMTEFWLNRLFPLFDWVQGQYLFDDSAEPVGAHILMTVASLEFVLEGIRRMTNFRLIEAWLPPESETLQVLSPYHAELLRLAPHEKYILHLLRSVSRLEELYRLSQLGKKETEKVVFSLLQLGLVGPAQLKTKIRPAAEPSPVETEKIWADFNVKCSYIYKYISKEIGPVGLNVLEKALDEVRTRFGPPLQNLELRMDGRIEIKPIPFLSLNLSAEENRRSFLRLLNEILVAEVLVVKKTLGNEHEAALIRNLERIGEAN